VRVVSQRLSQDADGFRQGRVRDKRVSPDVLDQLLPRHHIASPTEEHLQYPKHPRRKRQLDTVTFQEPGGGVEFERAKGDVSPHVAKINAASRRSSDFLFWFTSFRER